MLSDGGRTRKARRQLTNQIEINPQPLAIWIMGFSSFPSAILLFLWWKGGAVRGWREDRNIGGAGTKLAALGVGGVGAGQRSRVARGDLEQMTAK